VPPKIKRHHPWKQNVESFITLQEGKGEEKKVESEKKMVKNI